MKRRAPRLPLLAAMLAFGMGARPAPGPLVVVRAIDPDRVDAPTREAFRAAFGRDSPALVTRDGRDFDFHPIASVDLGQGHIALVSTGAVRDAGHAETGLNAIHYFERRGGRLRPAGQWFGIGADGSHGVAANSWGLTRSLSRWAVLYTEGGGTWQGCTVSAATLTELRPGGPVDLVSLPVHFDDVGMAGARSGRTVDGALARAVPDRSFTVRYSGSMRFSETYVRAADGRYRLTGRTSRMPGC